MRKAICAAALILCCAARAQEKYPAPLTSQNVLDYCASQYQTVEDGAWVAYGGLLKTSPKGANVMLTLADVMGEAAILLRANTPGTYATLCTPEAFQKLAGLSSAMIAKGWMGPIPDQPKPVPGADEQRLIDLIAQQIAAVIAR